MNTLSVFTRDTVKQPYLRSSLIRLDQILKNEFIGYSKTSLIQVIQVSQVHKISLLRQGYSFRLIIGSLH